MSGVGILCFAASYFVALCLEAARFFFRGPIRAGLTIFWIAAGIVAHTAYLYYHHALTVAAIDGIQSYFLVSAWGLALICLYLACFHPKIPFGLILLPITLLLIGGAATVGDSAAVEPSEVSTLWRRLHAGTFFMATLGICIGFVAGVMYLVQDARLRGKRPTTGLKLPTLEWSLSVCRQAMGASIILLGACIFSGLLLRPVWGGFPYWNDPLVLGSSLMFVFLLLFSGTLTLRLWKTEGRYVAMLTLLAFLFLVSILLFGLIFQNAHWKRSLQNDKRQETTIRKASGEPYPIASCELCSRKEAEA